MCVCQFHTGGKSSLAFEYAEGAHTRASDAASHKTHTHFVD